MHLFPGVHLMSHGKMLMTTMCIQVDIPDDVKCIDTTAEEELPKTSMGYLITFFDRYILKVGDKVHTSDLRRLCAPECLACSSR